MCWCEITWTCYASQLGWVIVFCQLGWIEGSKLVEHTVGCVWDGVSSRFTFDGLQGTCRDTQIFNSTMVILWRRACRRFRWTPSLCTFGLYIRNLSCRDCPQQVRIWVWPSSCHSTGGKDPGEWNGHIITAAPWAKGETLLQTAKAVSGKVERSDRRVGAP